MKKITIALPEDMIKDVHKLADTMAKQDFWTLAITWRQLIKKGLAYFDLETGKKKKKGSSKEANEEPKDQRQYTPVPEENQNPEEIQKEIEQNLKKLYPETNKNE